MSSIPELYCFILMDHSKNDMMVLIFYQWKNSLILVWNINNILVLLITNV
jgi:hypothetical protein